MGVVQLLKHGLASWGDAAAGLGCSGVCMLHIPPSHGNIHVQTCRFRDPASAWAPRACHTAALAAADEPRGAGAEGCRAGGGEGEGKEVVELARVGAGR